MTASPVDSGRARLPRLVEHVVEDVLAQDGGEGELDADAEHDVAEDYQRAGDGKGHEYGSEAPEAYRGGLLAGDVVEYGAGREGYALRYEGDADGPRREHCEVTRLVAGEADEVPPGAHGRTSSRPVWSRRWKRVLASAARRSRLAVLDEATLFQDGDVVAAADGGEVVGDDDDGAVSDEAVDGALDHLLGAAV